MLTEQIGELKSENSKYRHSHLSSIAVTIWHPKLRVSFIRARPVQSQLSVSISFADPGYGFDVLHLVDEAARTIVAFLEDGQLRFAALLLRPTSRQLVRCGTGEGEEGRLQAHVQIVIIGGEVEGVFDHL